MTELAEQHTASFKYPHVVEAALDAWVATESGNWRLSDALVEDIGIEYHRPEQYVLDRKDVSAPSGLFAKIEEAYLEAKRAGAKEIKAKSLSTQYHTAAAWPPATRVSQASYEAHKALNTREFDGRREQLLLRLVERSSDGWVSGKNAQRWKSDRKGSPPVAPFLEQVENVVRGALKRKIPTAQWHRLSEDDRAAIGKMLRQIAYEVENSEFGR